MELKVTNYSRPTQGFRLQMFSLRSCIPISVLGAITAIRESGGRWVIWRCGMTFYLGRAFNPVNFGWQTVCWWCGLEFQNSETESLILALVFFTCGPWTSTVHRWASGRARNFWNWILIMTWYVHVSVEELMISLDPLVDTVRRND